MLMAVNEPYALMVQPDDILISPREVDEHFGTMVCFHPRYALGDHHNYMDKDDFLREMYLDTVGHDEAGMKRYERMVNIVSSRFRHGPKTEERAIDEAMQKVISEKYLMLPLYLYDHSGLAMSTESFSGRAPHAEWDSGQVGWIYVSKEDALREFDADKMTGAIRQKADALMRSEVAAYDSYLRGECYGFELYKNGELSDSCWGFMGNFSDVLKDMAEYLPDECKGMVDHLEEQERPATIIKTLLKHAKIQVDQAAKLSGRVLRAAIAAVLQKMEQERTMPKVGRNSMKRLTYKDPGANTIEVSGRIRSFERYARKHQVRYHIEKELGTDPPKWTVYFKANQADALTAAFKEYTKKDLTRSSRPSLLTQLHKFKELAQSLGRDRVKNKEHGGPER